MESSAFVPSRLKGGMCRADDYTAETGQPQSLAPLCVPAYVFSVALSLHPMEESVDKLMPNSVSDLPRRGFRA